MKRRGQSAAFLKALRKKHGLGEFNRGGKRRKARGSTARRRGRTRISRKTVKRRRRSISRSITSIGKSFLGIR